MIKVEGLTKRYARTLAVDDISFQVEKGQIVGFLGPNGAGKTTTMRVLTCFLPPTAGLDPKQINETRDLIKSLAGDHTIILSTHILSEVEHSCERVIIINHGKLVAQDTVVNLTNRLRGSEQVALEIQCVNGDLNQMRQRLEQVAGVSHVVLKDTKDNRCSFEVESMQGRSIRAELARAVVNAGWDLNELRAVGLSLEDIFLQLTAAEKAETTEKTEKKEEAAKV